MDARQLIVGGRHIPLDRAIRAYVRAQTRKYLSAMGSDAFLIWIGSATIDDVYDWLEGTTLEDLRRLGIDVPETRDLVI